MGLVKWVGLLQCGHVVGGECAEEYLPRPEDYRDSAICGECVVAHANSKQLAPNPVRMFVDVVDSRPLRVPSADAVRTAAEREGLGRRDEDDRPPALEEAAPA